MNMKRVLIVDDHPLAREAIKSILEISPSYVVVGEAANGEEAFEICNQENPDLILMDINMPIVNGLEATKIIKQHFPEMKIVILSVSDDVGDLFAAIQYGAQGYLLKNMEPDYWIEYLDSLVQGNTDTAREIGNRVLYQFKEHKQQFDDVTLTPREKEILYFVAIGETNKQIADRFFITENTVKTHVKNMMEKLHVQNRVQLASFAVSNGIIKVQ